MSSNSLIRISGFPFVLNVPDIHPLRPGHALVVPRTHCPRVSELPAEFAAAVGMTVSKVAHAITEGTA